MFRVIKDLYSNNKARVMVNHRLSREFEINSGVMQGSKLGPILFNIFINDLLEELHNSPYGAPMGDFRIATLGYADDVVLISNSKSNMQKLLDICDKWAKKNAMGFKLSKCKAMVFNRSPRTVHRFFILDNQYIEVVKEYKYLGITFSTKRLTNPYSKHFDKAMKKAKRRLQCITHMGFHADGLRIETSVRMYKLLVRPILEYCAQVLIYRQYFLSSPRNINATGTRDYTHKLEHFQTQALKRLLNCPKYVPAALVRLFVGVESLASRFELLKLRYFWKLSHSHRKSIAKSVYLHARQRFLGSNKGFVHEVFNLCCKYGDINLWHGVYPSVMKKISPLTTIKNLVVKRNYSIDISTARGTKSVYAFLFLRNQSPLKWIFEKYKIAFRKAGFFKNSDARKRFVKALLTTNPFPQKCNFCNSLCEELLQHQINECKNLELQRQILSMEIFLNRPNESTDIYLENLNEFFSCIIHDKRLVKCFTNFLQLVDY